jgi:predicted transcriptional regulator
VTVRVPVGGPGSGAATPVDNAGSEAGFQQALGQTAKAPVRPVTARAATARGAGQQQRPSGPPSAPSQTSPRAPDTNGSVGHFSSIGERLVALRRQLGVTQVDLAKRMGSTQPALARLEKGDMKPNLRTLSRYGEAIGQRVRVSFAQSGEGKGAVEPLAVCSIDEVPETVAQVRRTLGLTQVQVAAAMESSQPVIARLETGDGIPNLRTLERYCEALGVDAEIRFEALNGLGA